MSLSCSSYVATAQSFVRWELSTSVSIPSVILTSLTWPASAAYTQGTAITLNPDLFTFKFSIAGIYLVNYQIVCEATGVGSRGVLANFSDGYFRGVDVRDSAITNINQGSVMREAAVNSTLVIDVQQGDVSNLKVQPTVGSVITYLTIRFLG